MADWQLKDVRLLLTKGELRWQIGPFLLQLHSSIPNLAAQIQLLYGEHPLLEPPWSEVADFHVRLTDGKWLRRWLQPQVIFQTDGPSPFAPFPQDHALPLFEWGVNFCIAARANQYLILHTASLAKGDQALILPGIPGSGKSTLAAALTLRGWRLLSDEFALVRPHDGQLLPLCRPIALKNASIEVIRAFDPAAILGPNFPKTRKGTVAHMKPPVASVHHMNQTARPAWVVCPRFQADTPLTLRPLPQAQGFLKIAANAFNYEILGNIGFKTVERIVAEATLYELTFGHLEEAVTAIETLTTQNQPRLS
ncbi:MAG: HprK-related kinase A [Magnetococcus sp. DMHC-6]